MVTVADDDAAAERVLTITRMFDAPPRLLFRLWTEPEHMVRWFGPRGYTAPSVKLDVRPGGRWHAEIRSPDGVVSRMGGVYREIVPSERLVFSFAWDTPPGEDPFDTLITLTFEAVGDKTRLTFRQAPFRKVEDRDLHLRGWGECLDRLGGYIGSPGLA